MPDEVVATKAPGAGKDEEGRMLQMGRHIRMIRRCLKEPLPSDYAVFQTSRPTLLYFLLSSLDLLGQLDKVLGREEERRKVIDWIYSLQLATSTVLDALEDGLGFGGTFFHGPARPFPPSRHAKAHLAQTYTALCSLLILGDRLERVDGPAILASVRCCQCRDGSFSATGDQRSEADMRFVFCAVAICYILDDFTPIDLHSLGSFIRASLGYDGGFGQAQQLESHGGSTFCAVAAMALSGRLWGDGAFLDGQQIERLKCWAALKQDEGFHGRSNKPDDSCYSFWIGATLTILNAQSLVNWPRLRTFLLRMQDGVIGGFYKFADSSYSDLLHTYFSLAAFGIFGEAGIRPVHPSLNISARAHEHLEGLRRRRRRQSEGKEDEEQDGEKLDKDRSRN